MTAAHSGGIRYNARVHDHDALPALVRDTIDLWVSDFLDRPAASGPAARVGEAASSVLAGFLTAASDERGPAEISEGSVGHALLDHVSAIELPPACKDAVPELIASLLGDLEDSGRLSGGRSLGARVRAMAPTFRERAAGRGPDLTRKAEKIGRNDPCPCGSGKKYKKCHGGIS
jgi:hypothetical protein